jgi:hypothetical protein
LVLILNEEKEEEDLLVKKVERDSNREIKKIE